MIPDFDYRPPDVPLDILYQDDLIIVANKPAGLLSVPGKLEGRDDCLVARLTAEFCIPLTENSSRAEMLYRLAEAELRVARQADSQQASARVIENFPLISVRG